jgi:hypothetical protein
VVERVIFAMVANRLSVRPLSKLAGCTWVARRVFIEGLEGVSDDACYRAMDFLMDAIAELQEQVFFSVANLLNLEVDVLFFDYPAIRPVDNPGASSVARISSSVSIAA